MATVKQEKAAENLVGNGGNVTKAMVDAGYSVATANTPQKLTESKGFQALLDEKLADDKLVEVHDQLLKSKRLDHMVFPLYKEPDEKDEGPYESMSLTDDEVIELLSDIGGTVRKIVHGQQARHVYFWVANDKSRQDALKLAYDLKGKLAKKEAPDGGDTYNTFVQNNTINPNAPTARVLVDDTLATLMNRTKRKVDNE